MVRPLAQALFEDKNPFAVDALGGVVIHSAAGAAATAGTDDDDIVVAGGQGLQPLVEKGPFLGGLGRVGVGFDGAGDMAGGELVRRADVQQNHGIPRLQALVQFNGADVLVAPAEKGKKGQGAAGPQHHHQSQTRDQIPAHCCLLLVHCFAAGLPAGFRPWARACLKKGERPAQDPAPFPASWLLGRHNSRRQAVPDRTARTVSGSGPTQPPQKLTAALVKVK